jgi:hypothetical protein
MCRRHELPNGLQRPRKVHRERLLVRRRIRRAACDLRACPEECSGNGLCDIKTGVCACNEDFKGKGCAERRCKSDCSGHGSCNATSFVCMCALGWNGPDCAQRWCAGGDGGCGESGKCNGTALPGGLPVCQCNPGFAGRICETTCEKHCRARGKCSNDALTGEPKCA